MQKGDVAWARRERILRYLSAALLVYGAAGVAANPGRVNLVWVGVRGWAGLRSATDAPTDFPWLHPLYSHFDARPWLPWLAWLISLGLLAWLSRRSPAPPDSSSSPNPAPGPRASRFTFRVSRNHWLIAASLLALLLLAGYARLSALVPPEQGISHLPYDDEGVNAGAAQLLVQGVMPYRDYFFAHPPLAAVTYAPAMLYRFNEWGSSTSFMNARYLSVAYGLLTLALLFFIGLKLAGPWGGVIAGLLWTLDGRVVEINRKVMLDTPMVLFACAAVALYVWARGSDVRTGALADVAERR